MPALDSSVLTICLAIAASYLIFSIFVQTVQEVYKYLTNSKGRAYGNALEDFVGPLAKQLTAPGGLPDLRVRGPFQLLRVRPGGKTLPLSKEQLVAGLERTASPTVSQALDTLNFEVQLQKGEAVPPSPAFRSFLDNLSRQTDSNSKMVLNFFAQWLKDPSMRRSESPTGDSFDAEQILTAFRREFLSHVDDAAAQFPQFESNFEYTYKRRNLRQTFIIAFLTACVGHLSFQEIYHNASQMPPQQAIALANDAMALADKVLAPNTNNVPHTDSVVNTNGVALTNRVTGGSGAPANNLANTPSNQGIGETGNTNATNHPADSAEYKAAIDKMHEAGRALNKVSKTDFFAGSMSFKEIPGKIIQVIKEMTLPQFLGCLISALLVSFGAPFWNDLASYLLNAQKKAPSKPDDS